MLSAPEKFALLVVLLVVSFNSMMASAATHQVEIKKFKFIPAQITIAVGDTVEWLNKERRQYHSVWFKQAGDEEPDYFFPDESYQRTFSSPGRFDYLCGPHPKMTGTVIVQP